MLLVIIITLFVNVNVIQAQECNVIYNWFEGLNKKFDTQKDDPIMVVPKAHGLFDPNEESCCKVADESDLWVHATNEARAEVKLLKDALLVAKILSQNSGATAKKLVDEIDCRREAVRKAREIQEDVKKRLEVAKRELMKTRGAARKAACAALQAAKEGIRSKWMDKRSLKIFNNVYSDTPRSFGTMKKTVSFAFLKKKGL